MLPTAQLLDSLEASYGEQAPDRPSDPYNFLIWWYCGYPASDAACAKGWASLTGRFSTEPASLLAANPAKLAAALKPGGMFPELRALRIKETAERVLKEFGGDLNESLRHMPLAKARAALKKFHGIADPGADRILLFAGISPVAAVPSNCPHVLVRIQSGVEGGNYRSVYSQAQEILAAGVAPKADARIRAYLLLKRHGQETSKATKPKCDACPVAESCKYKCGGGAFACPDGSPEGPTNSHESRFDPG
jgi:endonuclease-3